MIHKGHNGPVCRNVAVRAFTDRSYMIGWLERRAQQSALCMATRTSRIGRAERAADMTTLAGNIRVRTIEYKSGAEVIKSLLSANVV